MGTVSGFQLFGDTVNTAARMESTGISSKIQISQSTADLLFAAGKSKWLTPRKDLVSAKGKGTLQTYFVEPRGASRSVDSDASEGLRSSARFAGRRQLDEKTLRLVDWNVDVLSKLLVTIIARRQEEGGSKTKRKISSSSLPPVDGNDTMPLDEVVEIIELPAYKKKDRKNKTTAEDSESIELDLDVKLQIREYVTRIAYKYNDNVSFLRLGAKSDKYFVV